MKNPCGLSGVNQYIGARYVPLIFGEWDENKKYEPLSVVLYQGASYTSICTVPKGIDPTVPQYWAKTGNYNAQVEQYRVEVEGVKSELDTKVTYYEYTPERYGAKGDGVADDTVAFYTALTQSKGYVLYLSNNYKVDFKDVDLTGFKIIGNGTIIQNNTTANFGRVAEGTVIDGITFQANDVTVLYSHNVKMSNCILQNLNFKGAGYTGISIIKLDTGSTGGLFNNIYMESPKIGISIMLNSSGTTTWITQHTIKDLNIINPTQVGFSLKKIGTNIQFSHVLLENISVQILSPSTTGMELFNDAYVLVNPTVFNDNKTGTSYSVKFDAQLARGYQECAIVGGFFEGTVGNIQYMNLFKRYNTKFLLRENFSAPAYWYNSKTVYATAPLTTDGMTFTNCTTVVGADSRGIYLQMNKTDTTKQMQAQFTTPVTNQGQVTSHLVFKSPASDYVTIGFTDGITAQTSNKLNTRLYDGMYDFKQFVDFTPNPTTKTMNRFYIQGSVNCDTIVIYLFEILNGYNIELQSR